MSNESITGKFFRCSGQPFIHGLAEQFYAEFLALNLLSTSGPIRERALDVYTIRLKFVLWYLRRLEDLVGLRFASPDEPFICWLEADPTAPIAGYGAKQTDIVMPSNVLLSAVAATDPRRQLWAFTSCAKSALFVAQERGLGAGIEFIVTCGTRGLLNIDLVGPVLTLLLRARMLVDSDDELLHKLIPGEAPTSNGAWHSAVIDTKFFASIRLDEQIIHSRLEQLLSRAQFVQLVECALDKAHDVRVAETYEAWLEAYSQVAAMARLVAILSPFIPAIDLPLRTALSQLEEIKADWGVLANAFVSGDIMSSKSIFQSLGAFVGWFDLSGGQGLLERLRDERLLFPSALTPYVTRTELKGIPFCCVRNPPERWEHLGWRLAHPGAAVSGSNKFFAPPSIEDHTHVAMLSDAKRFDDSISESRRLLQATPWSPELHAELAIALDGRGEHERALEQIRIAVVLRPMNPLFWWSLSTILHELDLEDQACVARQLGEEIAANFR